MPTGIGRGFAWPALQAMLNYKGGQGFKDFSTAWRNPFTGVTMKPGTYTPDPNVAVIPPTYSNSPYAVLPPYNAAYAPNTQSQSQYKSPASSDVTQSAISISFAPGTTPEQQEASYQKYLNAMNQAYGGVGTISGHSITWPTGFSPKPTPYAGSTYVPQPTPTSATGPSLPKTQSTVPLGFRQQRYTPERDYQPFPIYNRISRFAR